MSDIEGLVLKALRHRLKTGEHLHHRDCIHNMPAEEQIAIRGKTVEQWLAWGLAMPVQITPDDWQIESPFTPEPTDSEERS